MTSDVTGEMGWQDAEGNLFLSSRSNSLIRYSKFKVCEFAVNNSIRLCRIISQHKLLF